MEGVSEVIEVMEVIVMAAIIVIMVEGEDLLAASIK